MKAALIGGILLASASGSALAQTSNAPEQPEATPNPTVSPVDIIVTANKVSQSSQSVAGSLSVIGGQDLVTQRKQRIDDALEGVPGVQVQKLSTGFAVSIRGVSVETPSGIGDPATALNFDGIYTDRPEAGRTGFYDISRVEVLQGPQGTLYGRNSTAGVVNVITNEPVQKLEASASLGFGNYAAREVNGMLNVPVTDTLAIRGALYYQAHDGYLSNGQDDANDFSARLKALFQPSSNFRLTLGGEYSHVTGAGPGSTDGFLSGHGSAYYDTSSLTGNEFKLDSKKIYATSSIDLGGVDLIVTPSYQDFDSHTVTNLGFFYIVYDIVEKQKALESRLTSHPGNGIFDWTAGFFYYDGDIFVDTSQPAQQTQSSKIKSYAGFGDATLHLGQHLRLNGGIRYTQDKKNLTNTATADGVTTIGALDRSFSHVDYKIGLEADVAGDSMMYAKVSTGFRSGGIYGAGSDQTFKPEYLTSYEIGSKNRFFDRRLTLNLSAFYYDYRNYQATNVVFIDGVPTNAVFNAPGARTYGAEFQSRLTITPDDEISLGAAYLHARFKNGFVLDGVDYSGGPLGRSPEWTVTGSYSHSFHLKNGGTIIARADSKFQTASYITFVRNEYSRQSPYTLTNAQVTYTNPSGRFSLSAYVKNIEYSLVKAQYLASSTPPNIALQSPRTYGIQAMVHF